LWTLPADATSGSQSAKSKVVAALISKNETQFKRTKAEIMMPWLKVSDVSFFSLPF
jgi:hypothetical protein